MDKFQNHSSHRTLAIAAETGLCKSVVQGDLVAGAYEFNVRHQRIIRLADTGFPCGGQRTHRTAMEAVSHCENACGLAADGRQGTRQGAAIQLGKLEGSFIAFSTGVAEVDFGAFRCTSQLDQFGCQLNLRLGREIVADMSHLGSLIGNRFDPLGVGVSEGIDGDACQEIEVFVTVNIPDVGTLAVIHDAQRRTEHIHVDLRVLSQPLAVLRT